MVVVVGVAASWAPSRCASRSRSPALIFGAYSVALVLLLATDLDQRLLPNELTLPAIPIALAARHRRPQPAGLARPAAARDRVRDRRARDPVPACRSRSARGRSARATSSCWSRWACWPGPYRLFVGVIYGALLAGVVIVVLLVARRITLKTFIPFGPFLIIGALWAIFAIK